MVTFFDITVTFGRIGLMLVSIWVCGLFSSVFFWLKKNNFGNLFGYLSEVALLAPTYTDYRDQQINGMNAI